MKIWAIIAISGLMATAPVEAAEGMINVASKHGVTETTDRMERILKEKGMTVFQRIDHSGAAAEAGIELRKTQLLIFGNPKVGSQLMKCQQTIAIDLPQKALVWEDENGQVWISYNDPSYLAERHHSTGCDEVRAKIAKALSGISMAAAVE